MRVTLNKKTNKIFPLCNEQRETVTKIKNQIKETARCLIRNVH